MKKYLAGVFDSEGYVRIRRTNQTAFTPEAKIYMTNYDIINEFSKLYNLPIKTENRGLDRKLCYYISFNVKTLKNTNFLKDLLPFLNEKRLQLQEVYNLLYSDKSKLDCYRDYLIYKEGFDHPINGDLDYEYIAGVIDGDGWFTMFNLSKLSNSIINSFSFGLEQRYKPMIEYMLKFGGNVTTRPVKDKIKHIQTYEWKISKREMLDLLEKIEPFLIEKKKTCNLFINYIKKCNEMNEISINTLYKYKL